MISSTYTNLFNKDYVPAYISHSDASGPQAHDDPLPPVQDFVSRIINRLPTDPPTPPGGGRGGRNGPGPNPPPDTTTPPATPR